MFARIFIRRASNCINYSKYPVLRAEDVVETLARGSGPGGQSVNKSNNAVRLKHSPTGCHVRVHETRSLEKNRRIAWKRLTEAVDVHLNGPESVLEQKKRIQVELEVKRKEKAAKKREEKKLLKLQQQQNKGLKEEERQNSEDSDLKLSD